MKFRQGALAFAAVLGVCAAFWIGYGVSQAFGRVRLDTLKESYGRDEFVDVRLRTRDPGLRAQWTAQGVRIRVLREGLPVTGIGGLRELPLRWDSARGAWMGRWPCPWNPPLGRYSLELSEPLESGKELRSRGFELRARPLNPFPPRLAVVNWESAKSLASLQVRAPDGTLKDWRGLLDWTEYAGADAFWMLGGQTPGSGSGEVWQTRNLKMIPEVARECHRRGLKFGVWVMYSLTVSSTNRIPGYEYALEIEEGRPKPTRAVSLRDERRLKDVAALLKRFAAIKEVDFLGVDYIRNALGGYELAEEFRADMPWAFGASAGCERWSPEQRMADFARRKIARKDARLIDAWQWWRAHRVGRVLRELRREIGPSKPLWAFTLTWQKGWHHGQDPVMFSDAGADACALMMYEADSAQYAQMIKDWHAYVRSADARLITGDIVDWSLHQRAAAGPGEMRRRLDAAVDGIYADGPAAGIFIHDLDRALNGRLGRWSTRAWLDAARASIRRMKRLPPPSGTWKERTT
ncbi:MAG: hypothetical protein WCU88_05985 [Elusimicrobiota bacterium]